MNYKGELELKLRNRQNNARGHFFEQGIIAACHWYSEQGMAEITKVPEPFRVMSKSSFGIFQGRFTERAQPDFQGTLRDGRSIVFEAKYTNTESIRQNVITKKQEEILENHQVLGAVVGVCVGIGEDFFFVPWDKWTRMKELFGRKTATAEDLREYRVSYRHGIEFLGGMEL